MAEAFAFGEGEGEGEGELIVPGSHQVAPSASFFSTQWCLKVYISDLNGYSVALGHCLEADIIKLEAMPHSATDHMFTGTFDADGFVEGGFNPTLEFEQCAKVVLGALKHDLSMTAELAAVGRHSVDLHIRVPLAYFQAAYKLTLHRVELDPSGVVPARLKQAIAECEAVKSQLAAARIALDEMSGKTSSLKESKEEETVDDLLDIDEAASTRWSHPKPLVKAVIGDFKFDALLDASTWHLSDDRKTASPTQKKSRIVLVPYLTGGKHLLKFVIKALKGWIGVGLCHDLGTKPVTVFFSNGALHNDGKVVKENGVVTKHAFGGWQPRDHFKLVVDLDNCEATIRSPYGELTVNYKAPSTPLWIYFKAQSQRDTTVSIG